MLGITHDPNTKPHVVERLKREAARNAKKGIVTPEKPPPPASFLKAYFRLRDLTAAPQKERLDI